MSKKSAEHESDVLKRHVYQFLEQSEEIMVYFPRKLRSIVQKPEFLIPQLKRTRKDMKNLKQMFNFLTVLAKSIEL